MNYKLIPKGAKLFSYNQLSDNAKTNARNEVVNSQLDYFKSMLTDAKNTFKANLHNVINDRNHLPRLIHNKDIANYLQNDINKCVKMIEGNLCMFLADGTYITYSI